MDALSLSNPVFTTYVVCAALAVLKIMGQGWVSVYRLMKVGGGYASPEDANKGLLNPDPRPGQLDLDDYVDRSRRMHRNDLENIPAFLAAGLLFVLVSPPLLLAQIMLYGFVLARTFHTWAYATAQSHDVRSMGYTVGSLAVMYMAGHVLVFTLMRGTFL
jgi:glutathione S-transferase